MRTVVSALVLAVAMSGAAMAQSRSVYDHQSGNMYYVSPRPNGGTHVQGYNLNNGSMWNTDVDRRGNMRGLDSDMNSWSYNSGSKTYMNHGTGRTCVGEGYARTCF